MSVKIFFDMDGVLVNFAGAVADGIMQKFDAGDISSRGMRRLINYEGPDIELPITAEYLEKLTGIKDTKSPRTKWMKRVNDALFAIAQGEDWWATLPALPGYNTMIEHAQNLVGVDNVYICTAPVEDKDGGCERGKRQWIARNTSVPPDQVFVTRDKASVAQNFQDDTCILIDDRTKYCDSWRAGGGLAIRHVPPATMATVQNTLSQLNLFVNSAEI